MIGIFSGRALTDTEVYAKIDVDFREHIHLFSYDNGRSSALDLFLYLALRANEAGWAWPSRDLIIAQTGMSNLRVTSALKHLRDMRIKGHRIFAHYRQQKPDGGWGKSAYLIFPDVDHGPPPFANMVEFNPDVETTCPMGMVFLVSTDEGYKFGSTERIAPYMRRMRNTYKTRDFQLVAYYEAEYPGDHVASWQRAFTHRRVQQGWYDLCSDSVDEFILFAVKHGGSTEDVKGKRIKITGKGAKELPFPLPGVSDVSETHVASDASETHVMPDASQTHVISDVSETVASETVASETGFYEEEPSEKKPCEEKPDHDHDDPIPNAFEVFVEKSGLSEANSRRIFDHYGTLGALQWLAFVIDKKIREPAPYLMRCAIQNKDPAPIAYTTELIRRIVLDGEQGLTEQLEREEQDRRERRRYVEGAYGAHIKH